MMSQVLTESQETRAAGGMERAARDLNALCAHLRVDEPIREIHAALGRLILDLQELQEDLDEKCPGRTWSWTAAGPRCARCRRSAGEISSAAGHPVPEPADLPSFAQGIPVHPKGESWGR